MKAFFDAIRSSFGALSQGQFFHFTALLTASAGLPLMHRAYILATAWHETGKFQWMTELGGRAYFVKYNAGTPIGKVLGNTLSGDGYKFRGRGYVQLTGRANYNRASKVIGIDLLLNPDRVTESDIAAVIIVHGMTLGWFTGKKLSQYSTYANMRRVVNGTDKAILIAGYAIQFEAALKALGDAPQPVPPAMAIDLPDEVEIAATDSGIGWWERFRALVHITERRLQMDIHGLTIGGRIRRDMAGYRFMVPIMSFHRRGRLCWSWLVNAYRYRDMKGLSHRFRFLRLRGGQERFILGLGLLDVQFVRQHETL